jgi:hypothetical protein
MTVKFGGKPTVQSRMAAADKRLGATTGASKGAAKPSTKIKPTMKKGAVGVKITKKF